MKIARIIFKTVFFITLVLDIALFGSLIYLNYNIGEDFKIKKGETLNIESPLPVTAHYNGSVLSAEHTNGDENEFDIDLKVFGVIPFSSASVRVVDGMQVELLGNPFGMKLFTNGVLVAKISEVESPAGICNPAKSAGIKTGDYIISVNGKNMETNEDLLEIVENSGGKSLKFCILRNKKTFTVNVKPVFSKSSKTYRIGVWVRDSSAGIGTLTFYSPAYNIICGLGHGVSDEDTGEILKVDSGEIVTAEIYSIQKGKSGEPGQVKGRFTNNPLGEIALNCKGGVYSVPKEDFNRGRMVDVALKNEIKTGKAQIYCTVNGTEPQFFDCEIDFKPGNYNSKTHNMIVTVTDTRLLELTGGIVQGLSGSPLLQNGKLIGAVTHVLVDDPTKGYAIFAENMLETAQSVAENNKLKDAS